MKHEQLKKMVTIAMLSAMAFLMTFMAHFLPNVVMFLKYDPKDVIIAIGGFIFGPLAAMIISAISSLIEMFTISSTGWIGFLMNVLSSASFAAVAALIYKRKKTFGNAVIGIICGALAMTASMILWNYFITPIYMQVDRSYVASLLIPVFLPFNLLKAGLNASFTVLLYKPIISALRAAGLVKKREIHDETVSRRRKIVKSVIISVVAAFLALVFISLMILFNIIK